MKIKLTTKYNYFKDRPKALNYTSKLLAALVSNKDQGTLRVAMDHRCRYRKIRALVKHHGAQEVEDRDTKTTSFVSARYEILSVQKHIQ